MHKAAHLPRRWNVHNYTVSPDECDCARWSTTSCASAAGGPPETCSVACCGLQSKMGSASSGAASLLCDAFAYARSGGQKQLAAATIFAARHDVLTNSTILYYALDNVSTGVHGLWSDAGVPARLTRAPAKMSDLLPPAHVRANDGSLVTSLPEVRVCGTLARRLRRPRCLVSISLMCRLRFEQTDSTCQVQLTWPGMDLSVSAGLCAQRDASSRVLVAASAPVFVPPSPDDREATLKLLTDWVPRIGRQVGRVYVHAVNEGARVRDALQTRAPRLLAGDRARVVEWNWYEASGSGLRKDSGVVQPASTGGRKGRQYDYGSNPQLGMNPYHTQMWVLTKSMLELQDAAEWLLLVDIDEVWPNRLLNNRVPLSVQQVVQRLPEFVQQHPFCAMDGCHSGHLTWRPKSVLRIGGGTCEWWGHPHAGVAVDVQAAWCVPRDDYGNPVDVFSTVGNRLWSNFTSRCRAGGKLGMVSGQYFEHRRRHAADVATCEPASFWNPSHWRAMS